MIVQLSAQIPANDKKKVKRIVKSTSAGLKGTMISHFVITMINFGALSLIWGMIGSL